MIQLPHPCSKGSSPGILDGNASDMSGNGNHGTLNGATLGNDRHGVAGKAYSFNGSSAYMESLARPHSFDGVRMTLLFLHGLKHLP